MGGCANFQNTTLTCHQESNDHIDSVKKMKLRVDLKSGRFRCGKINSETADHILQLWTVYVMAKHNLPAFTSVLVWDS